MPLPMRPGNQRGRLPVGMIDVLPAEQAIRSTRRSPGLAVPSTVVPSSSARVVAPLALVRFLLLAAAIASCAGPASLPPRTPGEVMQPATRSSATLELRGPAPNVLRLAKRAYGCGKSRAYFDEPLLTVIDYSLPSTARRLWVLDLASGEVLFHELVAHGRGSGGNFAVAFSNVEGSKQSSLGLFRTGETYEGRHGYSLRLVGLEPGVNDRAAARAIVIHGADYVTPKFAVQNGRLGRSWGCPALDPRVSRQVIDTIKGGTAVFAYYPDDAWLSASTLLDGDCGTR